MEIYIGIIIALLLLSAVRNNKIILFLALIFLIGLAGYRDLNVGSDTINYFYIFKGQIVGSDLEFLFEWLVKFVENIGEDFSFLLLLLSLLSVVPIGYVIYKYSHNYFFSLFVYTSLFFYFNSFNIVRQSIAVGFCLVAYYFLEQRKYKRYILVVLIGFLFHRSAILALLLYPLLMININKKIIYFTTVLSLLLSTTGVFTKIISVLGFFGDKYLAYSSLIGIKDGGILTRLLLNTFLIVLVYYSKKIDIWLLSMFVGIVVLNIFSFSPELGRLSQIYLISQVILFSNIDSNYDSNRLFFLKVAICVYCITVFSVLLNSNSGEIVPYRSLFLL